MIRFQDVSFTFPAAHHPALQSVTFEVQPGQLALVTGPSGSGKSTLLRCTNGLVPHFTGGSLEGSIQVAGIDPVLAGPQNMSRSVGFVFQDPEAQFVVDQVEDEIAFALENAALPPQVIKTRVEQVLQLLHLEPLRRRRLEALSGGERQRVAIAAALALQPVLLVLDEPTSQLDPESAGDVLKLLEQLKTQLHLTILISEHRLERILPFTDCLLHLDKPGQLRAWGDPRLVLEQVELDTPLISLAKSLNWRPLPLTPAEGRQFAARMPVPNLSPTPPPVQGPAGDPPRPAWIQVNQVSLSYGQVPALDHVSLAVYPESVTAVLGPNGAGKTSLLRCLTGLQPVQPGQVRIAGQDIACLDVASICRMVAYLPQDPNALLFADRVEDELWITLRNHRLDHPPVQPRALLERLGLSDKAGRYPRDLSVGERQRVALAAVTIPLPGAILLDEPTRGLDYRAKQGLAQILVEWKRAGAAILLVTHDVELAASLSDQVVLLEGGRVKALGSPAQVLGCYPPFLTQIAQIFPGTGWVTVQDVLRASRT